jgi:hypothetical protein
MKREPARPKIAVSAPARAQPVPGCWVTWKPAHSLICFSKVIEPAPFGSFMVSPGFRFSLRMLALGVLELLHVLLSSWYTFCGMPELTPRSPW